MPAHPIAQKKGDAGPVVGDKHLSIDDGSDGLVRRTPGLLGEGGDETLDPLDSRLCGSKDL